MAVNIGTLLARLRADTKQFEQAMGRSTSRIDKLRAQVKLAISVLGAAGLAGAITIAVRAFDKMLTHGGEVLNIQRAFTRVTGDAASALDSLTIATEGLISKFDLMKSMNQAIALGSANNAAQFKELARTAVALGRSLGLDAGFALNSLNIGIARQSRLVLDNVGIILSATDANARYAKALGKNVDELTDLEQKEAFRVAAMEAARQKLATLGPVTLNAADAAQQLKTTWSDLRDEFSASIADSDNAADSISGLNIVLKDTAEALRNNREGATLLSEIWREFAIALSGPSTSTLIKGLEKIVDALAKIGEAARESKAKLAGLQEAPPQQFLRGLLQRDLSLVRRGAKVTGTYFAPSKEDILKFEQLLIDGRRIAREFSLEVIEDLNKIPLAFQRSFKGTADFFDTQMERVKRRAAGIGGEVARSAGDIPAQARKSVEDAGIREWAGLATEEAEKAFDPFVDRMKTVGIDAASKLIDGMIQGTLDLKDIFQAALAAIFKTVVFGALGIFSPSKLGIEAGRLTGMGFVMGVEDMAGSMHRATRNSFAPLIGAGNVTVAAPDLSQLPRALTPQEAARDAAWLRLWTETANAARDRGWR